MTNYMMAFMPMVSFHSSGFLTYGHIQSTNKRSLDEELHFFFFDSVQRPFQDYFTHIETSQSVGGAKREYPGKTT